MSQRNAALAELDEVGVVDEDAGRVVRVDDEDQLGLVVHGVEHALRRRTEGPRRAAAPAPSWRRTGRRATGTSRTSGCEQQELVAWLQEDAHCSVDRLGRAVSKGDVLGGYTVELSEFRLQPQHAVRVAVALLGDVGDRLNNLLRRGRWVSRSTSCGRIRDAPTPCRECRCCTRGPAEATARIRSSILVFFFVMLILRAPFTDLRAATCRGRPERAMGIPSSTVRRNCAV